MSTAVSNNVEAAKKALAAAVGTAQVGITPAPAPELNGVLLQLPNAAPVYLVLNGFRRWVPNTQTFQNLFKSTAKVVQDPHISAVSEGAALTDGAILAQANGQAPVYLLTNGVKMWIPSPAIFDAYQFDGTKIVTLPGVAIDFIPSGPNVDAPQS